MEVIGLISEADAKNHRVPGLERAISKSKGVEFASLLHQLGADFFASPWGAKVRSILVEIEPAAKDRLPKRSLKTDHRGHAPAAPEPPSPRQPAPIPPAPASEPPANAEATGDAAKKKRTAKPAGSDAAEKPAAEKAEKKAGKEPAKEPAVEKKSTTKQLSRKKPR